MGIADPLPQERKAYNLPRPIAPDDRLEAFNCGSAPLDDFLKRRALKNEGKVSRTYVVTSALGENAGSVVAFYAIAAGAVTHDLAPSALKRNMPNPLPVFVLGRMGVDRAHQGKGLAKGMVKEAMQRSLEGSRSIGARALIVHAVDDAAVPFYAQFGFELFPAGSRTLFLPIETIAQGLWG